MGLNKLGGVECDVTVNVIKSGTGTIHDPKFEVKQNSSLFHIIKVLFKNYSKGQGYYIVAGGASAYHTIAHINEAIRNKCFNASVIDVTDKMGVISLQGPQRLTF